MSNIVPARDRPVRHMADRADVPLNDPDPVVAADALTAEAEALGLYDEVSDGER